MKTYYIDRLQGEKAEFENAIFGQGHRDGRKYGQEAPYRELKLLGILNDTCGFGDVDANRLACQVCEVENICGKTCRWLDAHMSPAWEKEEPYVFGFLIGAFEVLCEVDSSESKKD